MPIFDQNHRLTPLQKRNFIDYVKNNIFLNMWKGHFYSLKTLVHPLKGNQAIYVRLLKRKTNFLENANSCSKSWVNPFKKLEIFSIIFKWHFCSLKCISSPLAHNKTIYLYGGLQGVTEYYRGLRGVTRGYRGLQRVTGGYRGLQRITRGYRGLQGKEKDWNGFARKELNQTIYVVNLKRKT